MSDNLGPLVASLKIFQKYYIKSNNPYLKDFLILFCEILSAATTLKEGDNAWETCASIARLSIRKMSRSNTCKKSHFVRKIHPDPKHISITLQIEQITRIICSVKQKIR